MNEKGVELEGIEPLDSTAETAHDPFRIIYKTSKKVFGLHKMNETEGSFVKFQKQSEDTTKEDHQMWIRTPPQEGDEKERFMLTNKKSGLYLYADWHGYFTNGHKKPIEHKNVLACKLFQNY
jgi:hypothetical protein